MCQLASERYLSCYLLSKEVSHGKVDIYLHHCQQKGKYMIGPPFCPPNYLKTNGRVSLSIVVVHGMPVEEVVANYFGVLKSGSLCASPTSPFALCFLTHALIGAIERHQRHNIVRLFYGIYVEMCIAHLSLPRITGANFLSIEVTSYLFSTNMLGPVSPLLNKSRCKNSRLFHPAGTWIKKPNTLPMKSHLKRKILSSDDQIKISLYQRYTRLCEEKDTFGWISN